MLKRTWIVGLLLLAAVGSVKAEEGFEPLFNGKDLTGWEGNPELWSVQDGAITGKTSADKPLKVNTFLVWKAGTVENFELRLKYKIVGGNSGIQYRSKLMDDKQFIVGGYQADFEAGKTYSGILYEERGRGILCLRGQKVTVNADGTKKEEQVTNTDELQASIKNEDWNEYVVIADGTHLIHKINGKVTAEVMDNQKDKAATSGILALQIHVGPPMTVQFKDIQIKKLPAAAPVKPQSAATATPKRAAGVNAAPLWIWAEQTNSVETVYLRRAFKVNGPVKGANLTASADNGFTAYINGKQVAYGDNWEHATKAQVRSEIREGENILAIKATNEGGPGALIAKLDIALADGSKQTIVTDGQWLVSRKADGAWLTAADATGFTPAQVIAKLGDAPWGEVFAAAAEPAAPGAGLGATPAEKFTVAKDFKVELLYSVPKATQGSWVNLCVDDKGRLITSDQSGGLFRITPAGLGGAKETTVEPVPAPIGQAHGLLYLNGGLYVVVNGSAAQGSGLYRVTDSDGDDKLDKVQLLRKIEGGGEHGPHGVVPGPDGKSLYVVAGNFTKIPNPESSHPPTNWGEDQILPRMPDGGGHDPHILAPAGWVAKTDLDGKSWELVAMGMRNSFDIAFSRTGELFAYDSDMEWDIGAPWYRPTRVLHVVSGADYGWRNGSGKWPVYYPDSTPAVVDIGVGSPTGVVFGYGAKFPTKYQEALFICDWSFGKMYALHLKENGATYEAKLEQFMAAAPLPLTDVVINPADGAMYFTIGGRGVQSGLYRVTYTGEPKQAKIDDTDSRSAKLRQKLEAFHGKQDPKAIGEAWEHLDHKDRFVRNAARIAVESQPVASWQEKALKEKDTDQSLTALLALARQGDKAVQPKLLESLSAHDYKSLSAEQKLSWLRVVQLAFIRMGKPEPAAAGAWTAKLDALYPAPTIEENYELSRMLVYLQSPTAAEKTVKLLAAAPTQEEQIHYAMVLRLLDAGWTPELRKTYFVWFPKAAAFRGGHSLDKFITNMKNEAAAKLTPADKTALADVLAAKPQPSLAEQTPREFTKEWSTDEVAQLAQSKLKGRNYENGRKMFGAAQCANCHRFNSEGGSVGPDLTGVAGRFSVRDLMESITEPSKVVSDQYRNTIFTLSNGQQVIGRVANLNGDTLMVVTNQLAPGSFTNVDRKTVIATLESPVSPMMPGLLNTLNEEELLDLIAYLMSGGDRKHAAFK